MPRTGLDPAVCLGSSQRSWVTDVMSYVSDHGGMRVVGTVLTQDDALSHQFDVLIVDDVSSVLSPRFVDRLSAVGRLVVGVFDSRRGAEGRDRMLGMGVHAAVASDAAASDLVRVVVDTVRRHGAVLDDGEVPGPIGEQSPATMAARRPAGGSVVVVAGWDGVTEVAVAAAHGLLDRKITTAVVDLDTVEPSIAQRLGLPLTPNVFTATEQLRLRSSLSGGFAKHPDGFAVIAGIPSPREWESLSETEAADLVAELARSFGVVLVKVHRCLEPLATFSGAAAGRFDVGRRLVAAADAVVAVTSASPLGSARLLTLLGDMRRLGSPRVHVVVNQAPASRFVHGEIREELERSVRPASLAFLPTDRRVRKASWQGTIVRSGPFTRSMRRFVDALTPSTEIETVRGEVTS